MEDIKEKVEQLAKKILTSDELKKSFAKDPVKTIEKLLGIDLPDDLMEKVVTGVKAKVGLEQVMNLAGGLDGLKKLF
ncbi:MAG: hypothetical protein IIV90_03805 [Oscillospiraceae bacterium]|nr:hypothetical protein [Oscillospiraceae bacterium]